ncbi:MAG: Cna B-type domain-containing protein, partial [Vagococcus sp.]
EFDADKQEIEWKIIYNPNGLHIKQEDAKFTDTLTYGTVIEDSITVEPNLKHTVTTKDEGRSFDFQFDEDVNQRVVITYKSNRTNLAASYAKNTVISGGQKVIVQKDTPNDGGEGPGPGPGPGDETSSVSKTHKKMGDYLVNWTVDVNKEKIALDKWQIEDSLKNGEFKKDTLVVTNKTTGQVVSPSEYKVQWLGPHPDFPEIDRFVLTYDHPTSDHYSISYDSMVGRGSTDNSVTYDYWHKGEQDVDYAFDYIHTTGTDITITKSGKLIPKENEIEWTVTVNGDGKTPMADQNLLRDPIQPGQTYVEGSAELYSGTGQLLRPDSKAKIDYDSQTNELQITDMEAFSGEKLIFRTSLDDPLAPYQSEPITNTAYYTDRLQKEEVKASASLSIGNVNESFLKKSGTNVDGKYVDWQVDINEHGYHLSNVTIYDDSWENQRVLRESIAIKDLFGNRLLEGIDYDLDHTERYFTIKMKNDVTQHLILTYRGEIFFPSNSYPLDNVPIKNSVRITADRIITTGKPIEIQVPVQVPGSGGEIIGKTRDLVIEKVSASNTNTKLRDAEFTLYRGDKKDINKVVDHGTTDGDGRARFTKLTSGTYLLVETKAPSGYEISNELKEGKVINVSGDSTNEFVQVIENPEEGSPPVDPEIFIDIPVEKQWKEVPSSKPTPNVTVRLFANDVEKEAMILRESNNYKGAFKNLPEKQGGKEIKYEIKEDKVDGYTTSTSGNNNGWVVTNTYITPDSVSVPVQKIWVNAPGATPSVTVVLYANGTREASAELNMSNDYKHTF